MSHLLHVILPIIFHKLMPITDAYQWNAHDHLEQTIPNVAGAFEKLICGQFYQYSVNDKQLSNQRFRFRSLHSKSAALKKAINQWLLSLDKGCMNSVLFLDIKDVRSNCYVAFREILYARFSLIPQSIAVFQFEVKFYESPFTKQSC